MSRSDRIPITRRSGPSTRSAPILCLASILTAVSRVAVGSIEMTSPPLADRMVLTVMGRLPRPAFVSTWRTTGRFNNQLFGAKFLPLSTRLALGHRLIRHHGDWARHLHSTNSYRSECGSRTSESPCHCAPLSAPQHETKRDKFTQPAQDDSRHAQVLPRAPHSQRTRRTAP